MRIVVAVGGNALLRRGEPTTTEVQRRNAAAAAAALARVGEAHDLVVTHGNGPQIGMLALAQSGSAGGEAVPLDVLGAESQGLLGYLIESALRQALPGREVVSVLTQVVVDATDPAFASPTKPIGPVYEAAEARALALAHGWEIAPDGDRYRRVVASPEPRRIVEIAAIEALADRHALVVCGGGGGVPVVERAGGDLTGVEAVIDKDFTSALLARELGADLLLLLTDVPAVELGWRTAQVAAVRVATPAELRAESFEPGTMAPKVEAACRFVEQTGKHAAIGLLGDAEAVADGRAGTRVVPDGTATISFWGATG